MGLRRAGQLGIERQGLESQAIALGVDQLQKGLAQLLRTRRGSRNRSEEKDCQQKEINPPRS
jgi:hypothetical protein